MKRILLLALLAFTSTAAAAAQGTLKITIIRTEIVLVNNDYQWITKVLCEETLPITVADARNGDIGYYGHSESCKFVEGGVSYTTHAYYLPMIAKLLLPGSPARDYLTFSSQIAVVDEKLKAPSFAVPQAQNFYTKELNLKNAIMTLTADQSVDCRPEEVPATPGQQGCRAQNPLGINAVFEYELN